MLQRRMILCAAARNRSILRRVVGIRLSIWQECAVSAGLHNESVDFEIKSQINQRELNEIELPPCLSVLQCFRPYFGLFAHWPFLETSFEALIR